VANRELGQDTAFTSFLAPYCTLPRRMPALVPGAPFIALALLTWSAHASYNVFFSRSCWSSLAATANTTSFLASCPGLMGMLSPAGLGACIGSASALRACALDTSVLNSTTDATVAPVCGLCSPGQDGCNSVITTLLDLATSNSLAGCNTSQDAANLVLLRDQGRATCKPKHRACARTLNARVRARGQTPCIHHVSPLALYPAGNSAQPTNRGDLDMNALSQCSSCGVKACFPGMCATARGKSWALPEHRGEFSRKALMRVRSCL
jgi:hypothetical protein